MRSSAGILLLFWAAFTHAAPREAFLFAVPQDEADQAPQEDTFWPLSNVFDSNAETEDQDPVIYNQEPLFGHMDLNFKVVDEAIPVLNNSDVMNIIVQDLENRIQSDFLLLQRILEVSPFFASDILSARGGAPEEGGHPLTNYDPIAPVDTYDPYAPVDSYDPFFAVGFGVVNDGDVNEDDEANSDGDFNLFGGFPLLGIDRPVFPDFAVIYVSPDGEQVPVEGEQIPKEGEEIPAEDEEVPVEADQIPPVEDEEIPEEGEQVPVEETPEEEIPELKPEEHTNEILPEVENEADSGNIPETIPELENEDPVEADSVASANDEDLELFENHAELSAPYVIARKGGRALSVRSLEEEFNPIEFPNEDPNVASMPKFAAYVSNSLSENEKDAEEMDVSNEVIRAPDLSSDTRVNRIHADKQGMTRIDPDAEIFNYGFVLKEAGL